MYQPPYRRPPQNSAAKPLLVGCGVLVALFLLVAACGAIIGQSSGVKNAADRASATAVSTSATVEASPTETVTDSPSPTPTPTVIAVDDAAKRACAANVQAAALRAAGWTDKADVMDSDAEYAVSESRVPAFVTLQSVDSDQIPARLRGWCAKHLPQVKAKAVAKKPAPKPKPSQSEDSGSGAPSGATAICRDGTYSFSAHRRGTCSHHGGVATWL